MIPEATSARREVRVRKLIVCNIMSLDGYYTGPGNDVMALPMDGAFDAYNVERLRAADTLLLGRASFDGFKSFWPPVADDPSASPDEREISRLNSAVEKVVVSDTLTPDQTDPWLNTRIVKRADAHEQLAELKRQSGKDILLFGSRTLWSDLLATGLVDELHLMIGRVVLGSGTPAFDGPQPGSLRLLDVRRWDDSDNFLVQYEVGREESRPAGSG
jgi:dihydrofolate reductase